MKQREVETDLLLNLNREYQQQTENHNELKKMIEKLMKSEVEEEIQSFTDSIDETQLKLDKNSE